MIIVFVNNDNNYVFTLLHQNVQRFRSKKELIEITLSEIKNDTKPEILCFTETFIKSGDEKSINLCNFELAAYYSRNSKRGEVRVLW